jgi:hypothetical protein
MLFGARDQIRTGDPHVGKLATESRNLLSHIWILGSQGAHSHADPRIYMQIGTALPLLRLGSLQSPRVRILLTGYTGPGTQDEFALPASLSAVRAGRPIWPALETA